MRFIDSSFSIVSHTPDIKAVIEQAGRVCYQSETSDQDKFIFDIITKGHESVLEHGTITVNIICDRGITHELVRHRVASYSQESTRYCSYNKERFGGEITYIMPHWFDDQVYSEEIRNLFIQSCIANEKLYMEMLNSGVKAQDARAILPNCLKTNIVITANVREWRHIFKLRCAPAAHPDMRRLMIPMLDEFKLKFDILFEDL